MTGRSAFLTSIDGRFGFDSRVLSALLNGHHTTRPIIRQADVVVGCAIASLVNAQQVLPLAEVTIESEALRDLIT
jgi:hypothetical protein